MMVAIFHALTNLLISKERVCDQELIGDVLAFELAARVIDLPASYLEINFDNVLAFELAAHPPSALLWVIT